MLTMTFTCYVDEAGCPGKLPAADAPIQPFLIVAAVALRSADVTTFTRQFNALKSRHRSGPGQHPTTPEDLANEVKGAALRTAMRADPGGVTPSHQMLDELLVKLVRFEARLFGQVVPKPLGEKFDGRSAYAGAMQRIARKACCWRTSVSPN